ncbi:MAG: HDOD domain-containing protein [Gammaproteobacteria bacterium]|nr:HDOD domain-containing protein [Gammaproteobacteria bacterium]
MSNLAEPLVEARPPSNVHIVRQPLLNTDMEVYAYDLLYGEVEPAKVSWSNESCEIMLSVFLDIGLKVISEDCPSVISITEDFVYGRLPLPFPPDDVVLELPSSLYSRDMSLVPLEALCAKGYKLSLVASDPLDELEGILEYIYMLKVDLEVWSKEQLEFSIPKYLSSNVKLVATNVNTRDEQEYCQALGFELFQGRFVSEPVVVSGSTLKPSRMALLNILKLLEDPDCDISDLEDLISQDITLSYKILRIINSAFYGFRRKIDSVKQAVVSLGLKVIRDWFIVISLADIDDKPESLMLQTLQRARMMQLLSDVMGLNKDTGFTIGLFSSIDAIMDQPMEMILKSLPLSNEITEALLEREGLLGELLDIVIRYERGDWKNINNVGFEASELSTYYFESMLWARGLFEQIKTG